MTSLRPLSAPATWLNPSRRRRRLDSMWRKSRLRIRIQRWVSYDSCVVIPERRMILKLKKKLQLSSALQRKSSKWFQTVSLCVVRKKMKRSWKPRWVTRALKNYHVFISYCSQGPNSDVRYSIQSVNPPSGANLFYIFPEDGRIMVSRPLTADRENSRYVVSTLAVCPQRLILKSLRGQRSVESRNIFPCHCEPCFLFHDAAVFVTSSCIHSSFLHSDQRKRLWSGRAFSEFHGAGHGERGAQQLRAGVHAASIRAEHRLHQSHQRSRGDRHSQGQGRRCECNFICKEEIANHFPNFLTKLWFSLQRLDLENFRRTKMLCFLFGRNSSTHWSSRSWETASPRDSSRSMKKPEKFQSPATWGKTGIWDMW